MTLAPAARHSPDDALGGHLGRVARRRPLGGAGPGRRAGAIADLGTHAVTPLGADRGKELRNPSTLFRAGDTLYVGRLGPARTSRAGPSTGASPARLPRRTRCGACCPAPATPRAGSTWSCARSPGPTGRATATRPAVVRAAPGSRAGGHARLLAPLDIAEVTSDAGRRFERRVFSGTDQWGALPDGSLWVARVYENRVDWRDPAGKWTRGEPLPDRVLEVTRYDRELFLRRFPPELRSTAEQLPFAPVKPPFEAGLAGPGGESVAGEEPGARSIPAAAITWWTARAGCARRSACRGRGVSSPWRRTPCWWRSRRATGPGCCGSPSPAPAARAHEGLRSRPFVRIRRSSPHEAGPHRSARSSCWPPAAPRRKAREASRSRRSCRSRSPS